MTLRPQSKPTHLWHALNISEHLGTTIAKGLKKAPEAIPGRKQALPTAGDCRTIPCTWVSQKPEVVLTDRASEPRRDEDETQALSEGLAMSTEDALSRPLASERCCWMAWVGSLRGSGALEVFIWAMGTKKAQAQYRFISLALFHNSSEMLGG